MPPRTLIVVLSGALLVVVSYFLFVRSEHGTNNANFPDGTHWRCENAQCNKVFHRTIEELAQHHEKHWGDPLPCPHCGGTKTHSMEKE